MKGLGPKSRVVFIAAATLLGLRVFAGFGCIAVATAPNGTAVLLLGLPALAGGIIFGLLLPVVLGAAVRKAVRLANATEDAQQIPIVLFVTSVFLAAAIFQLVASGSSQSFCSAFTFWRSFG